MKDFLIAFLIAILVVVPVISLVYFLGGFEPDIVAEGIFEKVDYIERKDLLGSSITIITFSNGANYVMEGMVSVPFSKAEKIRILRHSGANSYKIIKIN